MLEIASLKIDNESHYLLIIPTIVANVKKIEVNLWIITRIGLIIPIIFVNVKKICKKYQRFSVKVKNNKVLEVQLLAAFFKHLPLIVYALRRDITLRLDSQTVLDWIGFLESPRTTLLH